MRWRIALLVALPLAALTAWLAGAFDRADPATLAALLRESGPWGPMLFVVSLALANGLGLPAVLFVLTAVAVWPPIQAFLLLWIGAIGAGLVGYVFARGLGRAWVEPRLPLFLRNLDERAARHELRTVIFVRMALYLLGPSHWALGLSSIRPTPLLVGSIVGFVPLSALWAFAGGGLLAELREGRGRGWIALLVVIVLALVLVPRWWIRRRAARDRP